jgi:DNA-binding NarL/FixJ family response regulator
MRRNIQGRCRVCAEAADAATAIAVAVRERPDICLLAADLPGGALAAVAAIARAVPETAIVVIGDRPDDYDLIAALDAGAVGYLPSEMKPERLSRTLRSIARGEAPLPRALVTRLIRELRARQHLRRSPAVRGLTNREVEVLDLLAHGLATSEIAKRLYVAPVTVRSHIASALRKLGLHDREGAVRLLRAR